MKSILLFSVFLMMSYGLIAQGSESSLVSDSQKGLSKEQYELILERTKKFPPNAQLSIALIKNGETKFFGIKRENDSSMTFDNHQMVFETGSISKVFTGTLLANFARDKKLELDDPIHTALDFPLKDQVEITFKQLATHTSGLPRIPPSLDSVSLDNPYKEYGEEVLRKYLSEELVMVNKPGESCDYSNLGFGLLGYVLGEIEDATYEEMAQNLIFSRYDMKHSTTDRKLIESTLVKGLNDKGEEVPNWDMAVHMGAGGILSSVEDMAKFGLAQFDPSHTELELSRTNFFKVTENYSMALGWSIIRTESGAVWNWHNGGTGGYTSSMILDTKAKNGVIILSNLSALGELTQEVTGLSPDLMKSLYE